MGVRGERRTPLLIAAAVIALLAAGLVWGGGDEEAGRPREERDNRDRSELKPRPTTTSTRPLPTTTASTSTTLLLGPVFAQPTGAALLMPDQSDHWTWLDLDSGLRRDVDVLAVDAFNVVPVRHGVVVMRGGGAWYEPLPEGTSVELGPANQILASGLADAVWLVRSGVDSGLPSTSGTSARLVDIAGETRLSVAVPQLSFAFAATPDGLVFTAAGRTYLAGVEGVRPLAEGELLGTAGWIVVVLTCDDQAVCSPRVLDTATGRSHDLPPIPNAAQLGITVLPAEDGRVAIARFDSATILSVYDAAGRFAASSEPLGVAWSPQWLPGDLGLVAVGQRGVARVVVGPSQLLQLEVIPALADQRGEVVHVIPG